MFPENILINLVDKLSGLPVQNIALTLYLYSKKKNDLQIILPNSDSLGQVQISREDIEKKINLAKNIFLMDYVSGLENYKDSISIEVMSIENIIKVYRAGMDYNQRLENPLTYKMLELAENYKIKRKKEDYKIDNRNLKLLKLEMGLYRQADDIIKEQKKDFTNDKIFIIAGYGDLNSFIENFNAKDINKKSRFGISLLHASIAGQKHDIVDYILQNDANINITDYKGRTALHYISYFPNIDITKKLLEKGADINIKDIYGSNAFLTAVILQRNNKELLELMIKYSPKMEPNSAGISPLQMARFHKNVYLEQLIKTNLL
jgi:Ankyrin repeat.